MMMSCVRDRMVLVAFRSTVHVISPALGLEVVLARIDVEVHASQHVGQHRIRLETKVIGTHVHWHVSIAQVVGRARKPSRVGMIGARPHAHHRLRCGAHVDDRPVLTHEGIAAAQHRASGQKDRNRFTLARARLETALLPGVPIQCDARRATQHRGCKAPARVQMSPVDAHVVLWSLRDETQNKK
jgi:hypothetical protein